MKSKKIKKLVLGGFILLAIISIIVIKNNISINKIALDEVKLKEEGEGRRTFAIMVENDSGEYEEYTDSDEWPTGKTYNEEKSQCIDNNGDTVEGILTFDEDNNKATVKTNKTVYCYLYFDNKKKSGAEQIEEWIDEYGCFDDTLALTLEEDEELISCEDIIEDETEDKNLRFIGEDPNNYVKFSEEDEELWRIIGVFNNIVTSTGETETLIKIIFAEVYDVEYWDTGYSNDWTKSSLMEKINRGEIMEDGTFALTDIQDEMTESVVWKLGGVPDYTTASVSEFYAYERGTTVYSGHKTRWTGKIALMYPSDFGYATSGGSTSKRKNCLRRSMNFWDNFSNCYENDWLYDSSWAQWTLTPWSETDLFVLYVGKNGHVESIDSLAGAGVRPVVFLKASVYITSGSGSETDPWILAM